jgi:glycosyltransferase involved in cell wall biosynthesis
LDKTINSILLTDSGINKTSGGGIVSLNLLEILQEISDVKLILSGQHFPDGKYDGKIQSYCIKDGQFNYYCPYFSDYFSKALIQSEDISSIELAISYGCPWGDTFEYLKKNTFSKLIADLAPHNISLSRQEHMSFTGKYDYPHLTYQFLLDMYLKHLRLSDLVIVHSNKSAQYIMETAQLKELPTVIPHGAFLPSEEDILPYPEDFRPGYFGSMGLDKGLIYLLRAWLKSNVAESSKLWIGGAGTENFLEIYKIDKDFLDKFNVVGAVEHIGNFFNNISVYVQPSIQDGFGITPLEAMSFKRPVIVSEGAGVSELVEDGKSGFVVPMRSPEAIKEKIEYFVDNPMEITRMGKNAYAVASKWTWEIVKKKYIDVFKELI